MTSLEKLLLSEQSNMIVICLLFGHFGNFAALSFKFVSIFHFKNYLQVIMIIHKIDTIQYNITFGQKQKRKTHLIAVAGIALTGQADLIFIMVP